MAPIPPKGPRGPRKAVISKDGFMEVLLPKFKELGVVFKNSQGKITQSQADYWNLFKATQAAIVAAAAAAGTSVSLAGVGTFNFAEAGRTEESRCKRFKYHPSQAVQKIFMDNRELVQNEPLADNSEAFAKKFNEIFGLLYTAAPKSDVIVADDSEEVVEASSEDPTEDPTI